MYYNLGYLYQQQGLYAEAAAQYEKAVRLVPNFLQARANLGRVYHLQHRPGEAIAEYQRALADHPDEGRLYAHLGESYMALSQYAEARAAYRRAVDLGVETASAFYDLGVISEQEGKLEAARSYFPPSLAQGRWSTPTPITAWAR